MTFFAECQAILSWFVIIFYANFFRYYNVFVPNYC